MPASSTGTPPFLISLYSSGLINERPGIPFSLNGLSSKQLRYILIEAQMASMDLLLENESVPHSKEVMLASAKFKCSHSLFQ